MSGRIPAVLAPAFCLFLASIASAGPSGLGQGYGFAVGAGRQEYPQVVPDGLAPTANGSGALVIWQDGERGQVASVLRVQHLLATRGGDPRWPVGGVVVTRDPGQQSDAGMAPDGTGGAFVAWNRYYMADTASYTWDEDAYAQHVLASGRIDPAWPAGGLMLPVGSGHQSMVGLLGDGRGGALVTIQSGEDASLYAQRLTADGVDPAWPAGGVASGTAQQFGGAVTDGHGGEVLLWTASRIGSSDLYAQHVLASGVVDPAWPADGCAVCTAPDIQINARLVPDEGGGVIVAWEDFRDFNAGYPPPYRVDAYAQHVLASGTVDPAWPANGRRVSTGEFGVLWPEPAIDGAGGAIIAWADGREGRSQVYACHLMSTGVLDPSWPAGGRNVCAAPGPRAAVRAVADGAHGAVMMWMDLRKDDLVPSAGEFDINYDLYAQHLLHTGELDPAWPADGLPVCTAPREQSIRSGNNVVTDGAAGVFAVWTDGRRSSAPDLFAQHVSATGELLLGPGSACRRPTGHAADGLPGWAGEGPQWPPPGDLFAVRVTNPVVAGDVGVSLLVPAAHPVRVEMFDLSGRLVAARTAEGPGRRTLALARASDLAPGVYLVRVGYDAPVVLRVVVVR